MRLSVRGAMSALTLSRLLLTMFLWWAVQQSWQWTAVALLAAIIADILDGVIARACLADGFSRRLIDAIVDRFSIHSTYAAALWSHPQYAGWYWPLLVRDLLVISGYCVLIRPRREFITGSRCHTASSLSLALLGFVVVLDNQPVVMLCGIVAIVIGYVLLIDYLGLALACCKQELPKAWYTGPLIRARGLGGWDWLIAQTRYVRP